MMEQEFKFKLYRKVAWNFLGLVLPLGVAIVAIPILIGELGKERFGFLTLAWALVGYVSLFDLGLGRALTKLISEKLGAGRDDVIPAYFGTGLVFLVLLGCLLTLSAWLVFPWLLNGIIEIPPFLKGEVARSIPFLIAAIPCVVVTTGFVSFLEAYQKFELINLLRVPLGVLSYLGGIVLAYLFESLVPQVVFLVGLRICTCVIYYLACRYSLPQFRQRMYFNRDALKFLLSFGGWITVSNVIGPFMVYLDRFFIGSMLSLAAVTYYVTPYEIITKLWIVPSAIAGVLFPVFSETLAYDEVLASGIYVRWMKFSLFLLLPACLIFIVFAEPVLDVWLGEEFASKSAHVLEILSIGVFMNCQAQIAYALIQGAGRPDLTAKLHLLELPFYLFLLFVLTNEFGLKGAALAWTVRVTVDAFLLLFFSSKKVKGYERQYWRVFTAITAAFGLIIIATIPEMFIVKGIVGAVSLASFFVWAWYYVLNHEDVEGLKCVLRLN